ncbi:MAG: hypothetical protein GXN93_01080 [Candidatus Diapherotrites archaeon]|nr:hypothetical protein [Candidatus Diapherotrites archaeon]
MESAIEGFTLDEIIAWSDSQYTRTISWGRYVRYGGTLILGASLIYASLDWYYNYAKKVTNTPLDNWYFGEGAYEWNTSQLELRPTSSDLPCYFDIYPGTTYSSVKWYVNGQRYRYVSFSESDYPDHLSQARAWAEAQSHTDICLPNRTPLADYLRQNPSAAPGVTEAVTDYVDEFSDWPLTFDSPLPGVSLDPAPNGNQWLDNPFFDPLLDTDTDNWPDWFEYDLYSDPSNPASQPPSTADPDNDGYDNATERDSGTDPTDPNSRPDVEVDQDSDGDGIKDSADPCPSDPTNMCRPEEDSQDDIPNPEEPSLTPVEIPQFEQPVMPSISSRFDR